MKKQKKYSRKRLDNILQIDILNSKLSNMIDVIESIEYHTNEQYIVDNDIRDMDADLADIQAKLEGMLTHLVWRQQKEMKAYLTA